jgi:hypothetical protein
VTSAVITAHLAIIVRGWYRPAAWLRAWAGSGVAAGAAVAAAATVSWAPLGWQVVLLLTVFLAGAIVTRAARRGDLSTIRDLWRGRAAGATGGL